MHVLFFLLPQTVLNQNINIHTGFEFARMTHNLQITEKEGEHRFGSVLFNIQNINFLRSGKKFKKFKIRVWYTFVE